MPVDVEISYHRNSLFSPKALAPENKNIDFEPVLIEDCKEPLIRKVEKPKETVERSSGRPKNSRLSALASKRNLNRTKRNVASTQAETSVDKQEKPKTETEETPDFKDEKEIIDEERRTKKKYDLSSMDRLALSQNLSHMASQIRQDRIATSDIITLTHGLHFEEKPVNHCFRKPSRGMSLLFPGKNTGSRKFCVDYLHHAILCSSHVDEAILKPTEQSEKVTPFDFSTCPFEAVAAAERLELEAAKKRRKHPKRLIAFDSSALKPQKKNPNLDLDPLSAKRLLKNRLKDEAGRSLHVVIFGEVSAGKSTLLSTLLRFCDPNSFPEKSVTKVKWEAEKAGRPRDYLAWLVDELPAERRCGHSWDVTDASVILPSGRPCDLFDCPGNQLPLLSDLAANAHAFVMVLDVTRAAAGDVDMKRFIRDCLKILKEQPNWSYSQITVILNKMDRCDYSTGQANVAKNFFNDVLSDVIGNDLNKPILFIPVCAVTGDGLIPTGKEPKPENGRVSFNTCLIDNLENVKLIDSLSAEPSPIDLKPPVLRVRDVYENMGAGFTAVADVMQGLVAPGQSMICLPSGATLTVRSVQLARAGRLVAVKCAAVGELVHLVLWQVEMSAVKRGSIICHPLLSPERLPDFKEDCVQVRQRFEARIETIDLHGSLFNGRQVMFHSFASSIPAFVSHLRWVSVGSGPDAQTSDVKLKPMAVSRTGAIVGVELILESSHVCIPSLDIGLKFSLMVNDSLMATGVILKLLEDGPAVDALRIPDCCDTKRLLFHRSGDYEQMEMD